MAVQETCPLDPAFRQFHVVRNWCYLGTVTSLEQVPTLNLQADGFDADGYKILCKPILSGSVEVTPL